MGIDQSEVALAAARALAAAEQNVGNVRFEQADVYELPYEDAAFDVVYGHQILQHLADPVAAPRSRPGRVLRPGGYLAGAGRRLRNHDPSPATTRCSTDWLETLPPDCPQQWRRAGCRAAADGDGSGLPGLSTSTPRPATVARTPRLRTTATGGP